MPRGYQKDQISSLIEMTQQGATEECLPRKACRARPDASRSPTIAKALFIFHLTAASLKIVTSDNSSSSHYKLDCQPGELRYFNYESATKVWGSDKQVVQLRGSLRLQCMESADNASLKYLAEVISLSPSFGSQDEILLDADHAESARRKPKKSGITEKHLRAANSINGKLAHLKLEQLQRDEASSKAEPVFEEVAETADRVRRTVSGWFNKTWSSVKDFFSNIFTSSERSSVSREQTFKETGVDIASQCKSSSGSPKNTLPIDDSVFDDLEPKYYISASSIDSPASSGTAYDFDDNKDDGLDEADQDLCFFDDPKPAKRSTRATSVGSSPKANEAEKYERLLKVPFIFVQSRTGTILEIKFSSVESDLSIKNFKRHLCDIFATNLDRNKSQTSEVSPIGRHTTEYLLDSSNNSSEIKQSLEASKSETRVAESRQLIRALAVVGENLKQQMGESEERQPAAGSELARGDFSVLRTINSTNIIQSSSKTIAPDIDKIQVRVKQVQQISEGRIVGSAGQLGMSLVQPGKLKPAARVRRSAEQGAVEDISELLEVSSSFSVQLVPIGKLGNFAGILSSSREGKRQDNGRHKRSLSAKKSDDDDSPPSVSEKSVNVVEPSTKPPKANSTSQQQPVRSSQSGKPIERLVRKPKDAEETRKIMAELRELESELQMVSTNLQAESTAQDGQLQRLEVLRDQIQMRLNEELMRNRGRRSNSARQVAAASSVARTLDGNSKPSAEQQPKSNDLGLSLTQLIIDTGVTSKRKGSVYSTLEEIIQLESSLQEDSLKSSVSRLLKDTLRMDKLRSHCKSAIATIEDIKSQSARVELKNPFGVDDSPTEESAEGTFARALAATATNNRKRLEQCKQVSQLLLRVSDRQAIDLMLDLMDECNARMLAGAKHEELGYGPTSRYYRNLRQQFTELLASVNKPSESLLDRLMYRLQFQQQPTTPKTGRPQSSQSGKLAGEFDFTYVPSSAGSSGNSPKGSKYNKSLLGEEGELNNNEAAGSLVMTITELAARSSIGRAKRAEIADRLLTTLKASTCSLFTGPDLDILEAMANFREPLEEVVGKVVHLARRCRAQDQYLVACVHALEGQLAHPTAQRFLAETLKSQNASCTVKSEIVMSLLSSILRGELKKQLTGDESVQGWPASGQNQVDEVLLELVDKSNGKRHADQRCLAQLVSHYMSRKLNTDGFSAWLDAKHSSLAAKKSNRSRQRRAVINDSNFWDEAHCKRWVLPSGTSVNSTLNSPPGFEIVDESADIDDNLIFNSLAAGANRKQSRSSLKLVEREAVPNGTSISEALAGQFIRKRHKCTGSKTYGPKNAQAQLRAEVVNDLVGAKDENKFLARFRLTANLLGNKLDVGRMYLWHQKRMTRAHVNILGKSLWDTAHTCQDKVPNNLLYMPLFDFNLWLVKVSVGLKVQSEMGFFSNCDPKSAGEIGSLRSWALVDKERTDKELAQNSLDELELYPTISLRASGEATAKFVFARAGMSLASQYGYQGSIRVSKQPESCMSVHSAHQPMNVTFSSWFQLWDSDCHYWGSRNRAEPLATRWRLAARQPSAWLEDECLAGQPGGAGGNATVGNIRENRRRGLSIRP